MSNLENSSLPSRFASPLARGLLLLLASTVGVIAASTWLAMQNGGWQFWLLVVTGIIFLGGTLITLGQAQRRVARRYVFGLLWLSATLLMANTFWLSSFGRYAALLYVSLSWLLLSLFENDRPRRVMLGLVLIWGVGIVFADALLQLPWRVSSQPLEAGLLVAAAVLVLTVVILSLLQLPRLTLRARAAILLPLIAVFPAAILGFLNAQTTRSSLTSSANENLLAAALSTADAVDEFYERETQRIRGEALNLGTLAYFEAGSMLGRAPDSDPERVATLLGSFRAQDPINIASYAILDETGSVRFTTSAAEEGTNERDTDYFIETWSSQRPYATSVLFDGDSGQGYIYFAAPILDGTGASRAVLRVRYRAAVLQDMVAGRNGTLGGESFAVLFDDNLLHLAHGTAPELVYRLVVPLPDEALRVQQANLRLPPGDQALFADQLTYLAAQLRGANETPLFEATDPATGERINQVAVAQVGAQPWRVAFFQPQDVLFAPVNAQARNTLLLTFVVSLVMIGVALLMTRTLTRPLINLTDAAARVTAGSFSEQVPVDRNDEFGLLARAFNTMTTQLADTLGNLEDIVEERTRALQLSTEVSRRLSNILDADELVAEVVRQVREAFDYYHVHIYLLDRDTGRLRMVGGTGKAGEKMLARRHTLNAGQGLVGRAAELNFPVLVGDVRSNENWFPNPLLPETRAEVAVPIVSAGEVLGVLDVQHNVVGGLDQDDVNVLQSIANQVGTALRNADSFAAARFRADQQIRINEISAAIQRTESVDEALQVAVRELGRALGGARAGVRIRPQNGQAARDDFPPPGAYINGHHGDQGL